MKRISIWAILATGLAASALLLLGNSRGGQRNLSYEKQQEQFHAEIIGGEYAPIEDYPFMTALGASYENTFYHSCGGILLDLPDPDQDGWWILTAGHCGNLKVAVFGESSFQDSFADMKSRSIAERYCHSHADLALLRLQSKVDTGGALELPQEPLTVIDNEPTHIQLNLLGWGYEKELKRAPVVMTPTDYCSEKLGGSFNDTLFCTFGLSEHAHVTEQTDSGGPVLWEGDLVGIMFSGDNDTLPDTHLDLGQEQHLDWINDVLAGEIAASNSC